jgi:hypothetical protein
LTFYLILFGGITAFAVALVLLDWLGGGRRDGSMAPAADALVVERSAQFNTL